MKKMSPFTLPALALVCLAASVPSAATADGFEVTLLPPLETEELGEFPSVAALRLNDSGDAVGQVHLQTSERVAVAAFRYTPAGGMENLDPFGSFNSVGWLINNDGVVYGSDFNNNGQAAIFLHDGTGFDLIAEDMDDDFERGIRVVALNDGGDLLGTTGVFARGRNQPWRYTTDGGWEEFSDLDPRLGEDAHGVLLNDSGAAVLAHDDFGTRTTFLVTAERELVEIGDLGGDFTEALAMNESGQVVGNAFNAGNKQIGFLFTPGEGISAIRRNGFKTVEALHVTEDGTVAGTLAKRKKFRPDTLFVQAPGGKPKPVVKRRRFKKLAEEAGFKMAGMAVSSINDRLEFVGSVFGATDDPFEIPTAPFVYSKELGLLNLQEFVDAAGVDGKAGEAWFVNGVGQILVGVRTEERGTTAILTPIP